MRDRQHDGRRPFEQGEPIALGYHTGHWEIDFVRVAPRTRCAPTAPSRSRSTAATRDGRTQGTTGMFDSLAYRNDAAIVMRRLIRSAHRVRCAWHRDLRQGITGDHARARGREDAAWCRRAGRRDAPARGAEDAGQVQPRRAVHARSDQPRLRGHHGLSACGSSGGGCQFLGTAATSQVVAEALGLALPTARSHRPVNRCGSSWRAARRPHCCGFTSSGFRSIGSSPPKRSKCDALHAAFGGSTNLLLHPGDCRGRTDAAAG